MINQEILAVKALGEKIGYGNMMSIASALWRNDLMKNLGNSSGAFVSVLKDGVKSSYVDMVETDNQHYDEYVKTALL